MSCQYSTDGSRSIERIARGFPSQRSSRDQRCRCTANRPFLVPSPAADLPQAQGLATMWSASICPTKPRGWTGWCISSATALAGVLPGSTIPRGIQPKLKTLVLLTCDFICRQLLQLDIVSGREYLVQLKAANESRQMIALPLSRIYQFLDW